MIPTEFLGLHQVEESVEESLEYRVETPFCIGRNIKSTSPEIFADYVSLGAMIVSGFVCIGLLFLGG